MPSAKRAEALRFFDRAEGPSASALGIFDTVDAVASVRDETKLSDRGTAMFLKKKYRNPYFVLRPPNILFRFIL